ncbi:MAG TPA: hypothetical protein VGC91_16750, partial [Pyrinomonadaceae bacterium]
MKQLEAASSKYRRATKSVRAWLRRVMPRVAIVAGVLLVTRLLFGRTWLYGENFVGACFGLLTFTAIFLTCLYYIPKILLWLKRRLLWRVRRRLA